MFFLGLVDLHLCDSAFASKATIYYIVGSQCFPNDQAGSQFAEIILFAASVAAGLFRRHASCNGGYRVRKHHGYLMPDIKRGLLEKQFRAEDVGLIELILKHSECWTYATCF